MHNNVLKKKSNFGNVKLHGLSGNVFYISKDWVCIYKILISQLQLILEYVMGYQLRLKTYFFFSQIHLYANMQMI